MQIRTPKNVKVTLFITTLLLLLFSTYSAIMMKKKSDDKIVHCMSAFDSHVDKSSLHATATLYLYRGKGSVQISGDYISPDGTHYPVKSVAGMIYHVDGQDYHVRFTGNNTTFRKDDVNKDFGLLLPFSISSTNIDYVYQFEMQNDGSYLIRQNGNALIMCKKISRP
ncbi:Uncharacterised protein [Serratia odorifera]|uniref:Uncharacterized protein n=1 Tax=Serratia odorifera TaxID=618 RepID=A0A3S4DIV6_SEROD|nr:hypothetical protein [Serratia odorifera]VDZ58318.1 Uncharacterised protein [Serratia odorifera]